MKKLLLGIAIWSLALTAHAGFLPPGAGIKSYNSSYAYGDATVTASLPTLLPGAGVPRVGNILVATTSVTNPTSERRIYQIRTIIVPGCSASYLQYTWISLMPGETLTFDTPFIIKPLGCSPDSLHLDVQAWEYGTTFSLTATASSLSIPVLN